MSQENLSNEQLALLDALMYIDEVKGKNEKEGVRGISDPTNKGDTLGEYLNSIDINNLPAATKDENGNLSGEITSYTKEDWVSLINAAKNDEQLSKLKITSTLPDPNGKKASSVCFVDDNNNATVAFRGTAQYEWLDNGEMGYKSDTEQQEIAKDWVNSLNYSGIVVIGHSKGGNKAMYVTITTDKVTRCVALIAEQDAYVCNLFFNIAGNTIFYKSNGTTAGKVSNVFNLTNFHGKTYGDLFAYWKTQGITAGRAHMANSFFTIKDGKVEFNEETTQDPIMKLLHSYVEFMNQNVSEEDKKVLYKFLMGKFQGGKEMVNGKEQDIDYDPIALDFIKRMIKLSYQWVDSLNVSEEEKERLKTEIKKLESGNGDPSELNAILLEIGNQSSQVTFPSIDRDIRDFTEASRSKLIELIRDVEGENPLEYNKWPQWDGVDDFTRHLLYIQSHYNGIKNYYEYLVEKNNASVEQVNKIFDKAYEIDNAYKKFLNEKADTLKALGVEIINLTQKFDTTPINVDVSKVKVN